MVDYDIGLFLLKWIGLGILVVQGTSLLGNIGVTFEKYVISVHDVENPNVLWNGVV